MCARSPEVLVPVGFPQRRRRHRIPGHRNLSSWRSLGALLQTTNDRKEIDQWAKTRRTSLRARPNRLLERSRKGLATGSKELESEGLAQEAKGKTELLRDDGAAAVKRSLNDHTISIVAAILILTVLVQIILVKSWT